MIGGRRARAAASWQGAACGRGPRPGKWCCAPVPSSPAACQVTHPLWLAQYGDPAAPQVRQSIRPYSTGCCPCCSHTIQGLRTCHTLVFTACTAQPPLLGSQGDLSGNPQVAQGSLPPCLASVCPLTCLLCPGALYGTRPPQIQPPRGRSPRHRLPSTSGQPSSDPAVRWAVSDARAGVHGPGARVQVQQAAQLQTAGTVFCSPPLNSLYI